MPSPRRKLSRPFRSGSAGAAPGETPAPPDAETEPAAAESPPPAGQASLLAEQAAPPAEPAAPPVAQDPPLAEPAPPVATPVPPVAGGPVPPVAGGELLDVHEPFLEPLSEYELRPEALLEPDGGGDMAFAEDLDRSVVDFGASRPPARSCEWCNTSLADPAPSACPNCGAPLTPAEPDLEIPGLTTMSMEAVFARQRVEARRQGGGSGANPASPPAQAAPVAGSGSVSGAVPGLQLDETTVEEAVKPPADQVRRMMLQIEIEQLRNNLQREGLAEGPPEAGEASDDEPA